MKKIKQYPAFASVQDLLTESDKVMRKSVSLHIEAAKKLSKKMLEGLFKNEEGVKKLFKLPVSIDTFHQTDILPETPALTLLEEIFFQSINDSEGPEPPKTRVRSAMVARTAIADAGLDETILTELFSLIRHATNSFIVIGNSDAPPASKDFCFTFLCNIEQPLPFQKKIIV